MGKILLGDDYSDLFNNLSEVDTPSGIVLARPTGNFLDDDHTYMEVLILGKSFYAKPCFSFGSVNFPSKRWLTKYKDKIGVWVGFEANNSAHAIYLGVCPLDDTDFEIPYKESGGWFSTEFSQYFDDINKELKLFKKSSDDLFKHGVTITDSHITLGEHDATEGVILGNSFVGEIKNILLNILNDELVVSGNVAKHNPATIISTTKNINELDRYISKIIKIS